MYRYATALVPAVFLFAASCSNIDTKPPAADSYENDNYYSEATEATIDLRQERSLTSGDVDWITFSATSGKNYLIATDGTTDTKLELYSQTGVAAAYPSATKTDDDSGDKNNASFAWHASTTGTYYVKVSAVNGDMGTYGFLIDSAGQLPTNITVSTPGYGSPLSRTSFYSISWNYAEDIGDVTILLMHGNAVAEVIESSAYNYGYYNSWYIYSTTTPDNNYRIGICDEEAIYDTAFSGYFTIE